MTGPLWCDTSQDSPSAFWMFPGSVLDTDVITYTLPFGAITTALGACGQITGPAAVPNYVGQNEPGFGGLRGFGCTPTMPLGMGIGYAPELNYFGYNMTRNARYRMTYLAGSGATLDSNYQPLTLTANTIYSAFFVNTSNGPNGTNGIDTLAYPSPIGVYSFVYDDVNAGDPTKALKLWMAGNANTCYGSDTTSAPNTSYGGQTTTYHRSVASNGTTVTVSYNISYASEPNYTHGYNLGLYVYWETPTGNIGANDGTTGTPTITNFWAFMPGDSTTTFYGNTDGTYLDHWGNPGRFPNPAGNDRSDPYAPSYVFKNWLTAANGNGPAFIRFMEPVGTSGVQINYQQSSDLQQLTNFTWGAQPQIDFQIDYIRR